MRRIWLWIISAIVIGLIFFFLPRRRNLARSLSGTRPAPLPQRPSVVRPAAPAEKKPEAPILRAVQPAPPKAAPAPQAVEDRADDLTALEGIGPKIAAALNAAGIKSYARLAALSPEELERIVKAAGVRMVGHADSWPRQARLAADGKMDQLKSYQQTLRANRRLSGKA